MGLDALELLWCPEPESNRHGPIRVRRILSPLRLPISPSGQNPRIHAAMHGRFLVSALIDIAQAYRMEARVGIEPAYAALQAAA